MTYRAFLLPAILAIISISMPPATLADLPSTFDLRNINDQNYVTGVRSQMGGTCWCHGVMAAMEGNLAITRVWPIQFGDEPDLAEYHLDWWNGFNEHNNDDIDPPHGEGLTVHMGGDYRVAAAYLTRGEGAIPELGPQSYHEPPLRSSPAYEYYVPRHMEWYVAGPQLENIDTIKQAVMTHGVLGTCMCYNNGFMWGTIHYQPPSHPADPNHAVAIIGWDDNKITQAPQPGAWLCKNSWGDWWGDGGFFWISYYDKHCGQHPEMGAISFQDVEHKPYHTCYYHDYHGWRDTLPGATAAFNAFVAEGTEMLQSVSFFTAADNVIYTVRVYDAFDGSTLSGEHSAQTGTFEYTGFHTVDLEQPVRLTPGEDFYLYLELSAGGQPYDRSSDIPVLLGASQRVWVRSSSSPGESWYHEGGVWQDLYDFNDTANFCIKGQTVDLNTGDVNCDGTIDFDDVQPFITALQGRAAYQDAHPDCVWFNADCDLDTDVDFDDISYFIALLGE